MAKEKDTVESVGVAVSVTGNAAKLTLTSRFISAVDRLGARWVGNRSEPVNRATLIADAMTAAQVTMIEAASKRVSEDISASSELALRALSRMARQAVEQQATSEEILSLAFDELVRKPPTDDEMNAAGPIISAEFLSHFERSIFTATTEDAKRRWALMLAQEIRRPGAFSPKAMRVIDETHPDVAVFFQTLCENALGPYLPTMLSDDVPVDRWVSLASAELLAAEDEIFLEFQPWLMLDGGQTWAVIFDNWLIAIPRGTDHVKFAGFDWQEEGEEEPFPLLGIRMLSPVGYQLTNLFDHRFDTALMAVAQKISRELSTNVWICQRPDEDADFEVVENIRITKRGNPGPSKRRKARSSD